MDKGESLSSSEKRKASQMHKAKNNQNSSNNPTCLLREKKREPAPNPERKIKKRGID